MTIASPGRTEPRPPRGARTTVRDLLVLGLAAQAGVLQVRHAAAIMQTSIAMARRRLASLRDQGHLRVAVEHQDAANRYTLTRSGAAVLARVEGRSVDEYRLLKALPRTDFAHHEAIVDMVVALRIAAARAKEVTFVRGLFEWEVRRLIGNPQGALVPDAIVELVIAGRPFVLALEVDNNTENPSWFANHKASVYGDLARQNTPILGVCDWCVLVTTPSARRMHRLATASWDVDLPESVVLFADICTITSDNILGDPWRTPRIVGDLAQLVPASPVDIATQERPLGTRPESAFYGARVGAKP